MTEEKNPLIQALIDLGLEQGRVTTEDILESIPEIEEDLELLEEVYAALDVAEIPYLDDPEEESRPSSDGPKADDRRGGEAERLEGRLERAARAVDTGDTVGAYLSQVGQVPLLSRSEEAELAKRIERGREAQRELAHSSGSAKRQAQLTDLIEDGVAAREHLILANSRLVISIAKKYAGRGVPFLDLVQEGHVGLMRAIKKFDHRRGLKFSTYATWWIRQAITRAVADHGRTVRLPVHMGEQISKMNRARHRLTQELGRDPTLDELAEALDLPRDKVQDMARAASTTVSLERPIGNEDDSVLGDIIEDDEAPHPEEATTQNLREEHLREVLESLPVREAKALELRYGLRDGTFRTLEEVGEIMGITRERVRQIEAQALRRLRHPSRRTELIGYLRE